MSMIKSLIAWIAGMFEDAKGIPDEARVGAMLLIVTFCGNSIAVVVMSPSHTFDAQTFGIGAGLLATGVGAWLGLRKDN